MRKGLKVQQKGLLLVAIPLAFELVFVATLVYLQREAESAAARLYRSKEIIRQAEVVNRRIYDAAATFSVWGLTRSPAFERRFIKNTEDIEGEIAGLKEMVKDNPVQRKNVESFAKETEAARVALLEYKNRMETGHATLSHLSRMQITKILHDLVLSGSQVLKEELFYQKQHPQEESNARNLVQICLLIGVVANILVSVLMALFFSRDITQRLSTIVDNAVLLASGKPLKQPLEGNDEIARLDDVFHQMAIELESAANKERAIIDNAQDVICSIDETLKFSKMSPAARRMWGYEPDELLGLSFVELVQEEDRERLRRVLSETKSSKGAAMNVDIGMTRKDGTTGWMLWSIFWSSTEKSYFCVAHDISERKQLDQMKQDFVNMVSHDLRTPLTGMRAFLDTLSAGAYGSLTDKGKKASERIQSSLVRLVNLVNDLLDVEKMEAGKMEMRFTPVNVSTIVDAATDMVRGFAEQQKVSLECERGTDVELLADSDRMVQVVQNLLANAIKFSPPDSPVQVTWVANGSDVEVRIIDKGKGISKSDCEAIFDRFRQVKGDGVAPKGGTGLGLAICKAIVEQHNGSIGVDSQEGSGSTFWFRLPVNEKASKTA